MEALVSEAAALAHVSGAVQTILIGIWLFAVPKGTVRHRFLGGVYAGLVVLLDLAALSLHRQAAFGPFHILAVLSLATILGAIGLMLFTKKPPVIIATHGFMMSWSYAGLIAAGMGQLTVQLRVNGSGWVWTVIVATLVISGIVIQKQVPRSLRAVLGDAGAAEPK